MAELLSNEQWVLGKSGRPIRKDGKAHKKWIKEQSMVKDEQAAFTSPVAVKGSGRVPAMSAIKRQKIVDGYTTTEVADLQLQEQAAVAEAATAKTEATDAAMDGKYEQDDEGHAPAGLMQDMVEKIIQKHEAELCRAYESLGEGPQFVAYLHKLLSEETLDM